MAKAGTPVCSSCGRPARVVRSNYRFVESGLQNVEIHGLQMVKCAHCGNADPIIPRINRLLRLLALAIISQPYRLSGDEIRFLRKHLGMTGREFGQYLNTDKTTLSKWETGEQQAGERTDRLIRLVVLGLSENLDDKLADVVQGFPQIHKGARKGPIQIDSEQMSYRYAA